MSSAQPSHNLRTGHAPPVIAYVDVSGVQSSPPRAQTASTSRSSSPSTSDDTTGSRPNWFEYLISLNLSPGLSGSLAKMQDKNWDHFALIEKNFRQRISTVENTIRDQNQLIAQLSVQQAESEAKIAGLLGIINLQCRSPSHPSTQVSASPQPQPGESNLGHLDQQSTGPVSYTSHYYPHSSFPTFSPGYHLHPTFTAMSPISFPYLPEQSWSNGTGTHCNTYHLQPEAPGPASPNQIAERQNFPSEVYAGPPTQVLLKLGDPSIRPESSPFSSNGSPTHGNSTVRNH